MRHMTSRARPVTLSVIIIAQDEEHDIRACVESCQFADEVIVVDGGSVDKTLDIVRACPWVTVFEHPWDGYSNQWNFGIDKATGDWIMTLSADEVVPPHAAQELREKINRDACDAFRVGYRFYVFGRPLKFGLFQLHRELRCVRRAKLLGMSRDLVHEHLLAASGARTCDLSAKLTHKTYATRDEYEEKAARYTDLEAIELAGSIKQFGMHLLPFDPLEVARVVLDASYGGRNMRERLRPLKNHHPSFVTWWCGPLVRFAVDYVCCLGFLDGRTGFFLARSGALYTYRRYAKARALLRARADVSSM